jgi:hypothetical protein
MTTTAATDLRAHLRVHPTETLFGGTLKEMAR